MKRALILALMLLSSACTYVRPGSPLGSLVEEVEEQQNVNAKEEMPVLFGSIWEIPDLSLQGVIYRKDPPLSIEGRQTPHQATLFYEDGTEVSVVTFSPLERQKQSLPAGSTETLHGTTVRFGDSWCSWFNGSDLYEISAQDPLAVANDLLGSDERLDMDWNQFLWFYKGLPDPPEGTHLLEVEVSRDGEKRFARGLYSTGDEDIEVELRLAKSDTFEVPFEPQIVEAAGKEFKVGYREQEYVMVKNGEPVSIEASTDGAYAMANYPLMEKLAADVVPRIVSNRTSEAPS